MSLFVSLTGCPALMTITAINDSKGSEFWLYLKEFQISQSMEIDSLGLSKF